jgi:hypothetical protein
MNRRIRQLFSWGLGPKDPPDPRIPTPANRPKPPPTPKPSKFEAIEYAALRVMFATPIPAVWDGEGIK